MTIALFYDSLRQAIGRGASVDVLLPEWTAEALSELELEHTFLWMERVEAMPIAQGADRVTFADPGFKEVYWVKWGEVQSGGAVAFGEPLVAVSPRYVTALGADYLPIGYYINGVTQLVFDGFLDKARSLYVHAAFYTAWPLDTGANPLILQRHRSQLKALTMLKAASGLRDDRLAQLWSGQAASAKAALVSADNNARWTARAGVAMGSHTRA